MKEIKLYNTLTKSKDLFVPNQEGKVSLYSCGPTVYGDPHIGNMRTYLFVDLLKRVLIHVGEFSVIHVMNITDVGHLTDDGDQGEDKMEKGARREKKTVRQVARAYEANFKKYSGELQLEAPDVYTRATEYMNEQIEMIQSLVDKGFTYIIEGDGIYMDTRKISDYGKLAQLDFEGMNSEHRVDGAKIDSSKKKNLSDFALRKIAPKKSKRAMEWVFGGERSGSLLVNEDFDQETFLTESEYGKSLKTISRSELTDKEKMLAGFPGRHIECSAMASAELGKSIDIHTGGVDHITVHHTNEIAQAECSLGCSHWVNRRMHGQFLNINGSKVSKSKGDDLSIPGIIEKGFDPLDLRYFYFTGHYRSFLDFTWEALEAAQTSRKNLIKKLASYYQKNSDEYGPGALYETLINHLADDLDIVGVFSSLYSGLDSEKACNDILLLDEKVLRLGLHEGVKSLLEKDSVSPPTQVISLADQRIIAKQEKKYEESDRLREEIASLGRTVKDEQGGYTLSQND